MRHTVLADDLDGSPDACAHEFSVGDTTYVIDLTDEHWREFLDAIDKYRLAAKIKRTRKNHAPVAYPEDRRRIREWAASKGIQLAKRGRFPNAVVRQYYEEEGFPGRLLDAEDKLVLNG